MIAIIESIESPNIIIEIKHDNTMKEMLSFKKTFIYFLILTIIITNIHHHQKYSPNIDSFSRKYSFGNPGTPYWFLSRLSGPSTFPGY
jgi:hypothetical protein